VEAPKFAEKIDNPLTVCHGPIALRRPTVRDRDWEPRMCGSDAQGTTSRMAAGAVAYPVGREALLRENSEKNVSAKQSMSSTKAWLSRTDGNPGRAAGSEKPTS
jgi:hypothetical protein